MSEKYDYTSYPEGFELLASHMQFNTDDKEAKENILWSTIEMILNS